MIGFILKIFFIHIAYLAPNNEQGNDQILYRYLSAFDDETTINNWKEAHNISNIYGEKTFKRVIKNVREIVLVIRADRYAEFRSLVNNRYMNYKDIGYFYYETWVSSKSLDRISTMISEQNRPYSKKFNEDIIYTEYSNILKDLVEIMDFLDLDLFHKNLFSYCKSQFKRWINDKKDEDPADSNIFNRSCKEHFDEIIDLSHDLIESILPVKSDKPVYVLAHSEGFVKSKKCSGEGVREFTNNVSTSLCSQEMLNVRPIKCKDPGVFRSSFRIEDYMGRPFFCHKVIAKRLIAYLHFYSEYKSKSTTYEVILTEDNEYQITWTFPDTIRGPPKDYWLRKEVEDLPDDFEIRHKFGFIVEYNIEYSTVKSEDTENEGTEARLILLDCGHQLGLDLIDEFFEHYYDVILNEANCHICRKPVKILGSYNTVIYKYKEVEPT